MHICGRGPQCCGSRTLALLASVAPGLPINQGNFRHMRFALLSALIATLIATLGLPAYAQEGGLAKPNLVLQQIVEGLPSDAKQAVRVLTATFKPGDKTVYHSHRFPVTVYVLEGAFTLDLKDRPPLTVRAGEAMVEPANVAMTGHNPSATEPTKVVIFYVSTPDTPFLDPLHH
jgi:quercetin dioxygenase-like cupin family protein